MNTWRDFGIEIPSGARGEIDTTCPQCSPRRKKSNARCLSVNVDKEVWECKHCLWSGGLGNGQRNPSEMDPYGAPLKLPKVYQAPRAIPEVVTPTQWSGAVKWFLEDRAIPEPVLTRNHITVATEWCAVCEEQISHVLFPFFRDGVHVNTKHRCVRKHFRMEKGAERILYGLPDIEGQSCIVWVEGEIDKLSCEVAGFTNAVSVPDGAPAVDAKNYGSKFDFLASAEKTINAATKHIIAVDADEPGQVLQEELARRLGREKCYRVTWPDGIKDANQCLKEIGPWELRRCLEEAEPYPIEGIVTVGDLASDLDDLYDNGFDRGVDSGWIRFDRHYRARAGLLTIVTGVPGHGKSNFLDALLVNLAVRHGWTFAICSPENQPLQRHHAGILTKYTDKPFHDGPSQRMSRKEMHEARDWSAQHFAFVLPESPTIETILDRVKTLVYRMGVNGVVIDPWNEIEHSCPPNKAETLYISECLSTLKRFAHHHRVHIWLVAHPTKMKRDDEGNEPIPTLWDIAGSAAFRSKADYGLSVWRNLKDQAAPSVVEIQKIRFQETGEIGMVEFIYDRVTSKYREVIAS